MDKFVEGELFDIKLPYNSLTLPLIVRSPTDRRNFFEKQAFILTDAKDIENGVHSHLGNLYDFYVKFSAHMLQLVMPICTLQLSRSWDEADSGLLKKWQATYPVGPMPQVFSHHFQNLTDM